MPVRAIRTTTISILALGLLAGSAVGVAGQDEANRSGAEVTGRDDFLEPVSAVAAEEVDGLLVADEDNRLVGALNIHDLFRAGIM